MHRLFLSAAVSTSVATLASLAGCTADRSSVWSAGGDARPASAETTAAINAERPALPRALASYDDPVVRATLRERSIETLERAAANAAPLLRANGLEGLLATPSRAEPAVVDALGDGNPGVRFVAAMSAGKLGLVETIGIVRPLLDDPDPRVRMAAMYALTRFGRNIDLTPLARRLQDPAISVRAQAVFVLGEIGDDSAVPMLREAYARMPTAAARGSRAAVESSLMRLQVAEALLKLGENDLESVVRSALHPGHREQVEAAVLAAQIIGELQLDGATSQLVRVIEQPAPGSAENDDVRERRYLWPLEMRLAAARALAQMGDLGGVFVADLAFTHPSPAVRSQAAFVYGEAARPLDLAKLELMLDDPNPMVAVSAAAAMLHAIERPTGPRTVAIRR
jgi:HEAT repeat protein